MIIMTIGNHDDHNHHEDRDLINKVMMITMIMMIIGIIMIIDDNCLKHLSKVILAAHQAELISTTTLRIDQIVIIFIIIDYWNY